MIITCPRCTTKYRVSAATLGATARAVRCSNCGYLWTLQPSEIAQAADRPARQQAASASLGRQPARQRLSRSFENVQKKAKADRKPAGQPGEPSAGRNGLNEQPAARDAPLIVAPAPDAAAPPTADGQEAAAPAQPDGGGSSAAASPRESPAASLATELVEAANAAPTPATGKTASGTPPSRPARYGLIALAALAIAFMIAGLGILVMERDAVMAAASRLTALIGLAEPPGAGLEIGAVTSVREETAGGDVLVVQGTVTNLTDQPRPLPLVRVSLFDTDDTELQHVMVAPDQEMIAVGESIAFFARFEQPAPTARRIKVTFAARSASP